jgi:hypothetical protein
MIIPGQFLTLNPMGKMFQNASSLKPPEQLKPNCPGIVIAGAISKKIPGGKQLVDKISSIVDKKKKVRTSKVGDKVITPNVY